MEPNKNDGTIQLLTDNQGFYIAYHAWRTICATKDLNAAQRVLAYHLKHAPGTQVVGFWKIKASET
jgi:hypothetical protein